MSFKYLAFALLLALPAMAHPGEGERREHARGHFYKQRDDRDYRPRHMDAPWFRGYSRPRYERERDFVVVQPAPLLEAVRVRPRISFWIGLR